jgi:hypothetical protein
MAQTTTLQGLMESLVQQLVESVVARLPAAMTTGRAATGGGAVAGRAACAVPGCGKPHSGPRYRFFCREHKASLGKREQDRILAERSSAGTGAGAGAARTASLTASRRTSPRKGKKLDMSCRVEGCPNVSGGPRHGFMCTKHQKLGKKAQLAARDAWKAAHAA